MVGSTEGTNDRMTGNDRNSFSGNNNPQQLFGYLANAQKKAGPLDINTNEGRMLKEAGWVDDRGFISEQGISRSFSSGGNFGSSGDRNQSNQGNQGSSNRS
jgi:hypothetical protein